MDRANFKNILVTLFMVCLVFISYPFHLPANAAPDPGSRHRISMKKHLRFEHITTAHGLAQNTIYCIFLDKKGFLWFGTENGLNRYDGYELKTYEHKAGDSDTLSSNTVRAICEDPSGELWVGTNKGLNRFDRNTETFTHFKQDPKKPESESSLSDDVVLSLFVDHEGVLWVGTKDGVLNKFIKEKESEIFIHNKPNPGISTSDNKNSEETLKNNKILFIYEDSENVLWVGTSEMGLNRFDREKGEFISCPLESRDIRYSVNAICEDQSGKLWIGTENHGLLQFDRGKGCFTTRYRCDPDKAPNCLSNDSVNSIIEDSESNHLWIGTDGGGLNQFDPESGTFQHYKENTWITTSLSHDVVYSLYQDRAGLIWVGTEGGLDKLDKRKNEFSHWTVVPGAANSLNHNFTWSIIEDRSGIFWIGTIKGLNKFDRETETFKPYEHDPDEDDSLSAGRVTAIREDSTGMLWVGTVNGILNRFDRKNEIFSHYNLTDERINSIVEDHDGVLWVGSFDGLYKSDKIKKRFIPYGNDPQIKENSLSDNKVSFIFEDSAYNLWIGTEGGGLKRFVREDRTFIHYKNDLENPKSLSSDSISYIFEDSSGTLWVGTYGGGLNKLLDRENGIFETYKKNDQDGLPDDTVFGILEDEEGNLWISNYKGLSKFNPETGKARNYDARDGLLSNELNGGACYKAADGEMFFGGPNGFNSFYPALIKDNENKPPIAITSFELLIESPDTKRNIEAGKIVLLYNENVFTIEFSALDFSAPSKNRYQHKLEGVDTAWIEGDARKRSITYTNVPSATHTFRVKGANKDGTWNEEGDTLKIIITPPWWKTWWFRIALGFLIIFAIFAIHWLRTRYLRDKLAEQQRVQKILKQSRDEMERARDLAEIRHAENEKLLTAISAIFIAVDSDGIIFQWNKPAEKFFKIHRGDALKKPFVDVLKNCISRDKLNEIIEKGLGQDKSSAKEIETIVDFKTKDKKGIRLFASSISPIMDRAGKKLGFLLLAEDITNRKQEEMLRNLSKKLESLGQMASGIAHEIKTPLQYIGHNARFVSDSFHDAVRFYKTIIDSLPEIENSGKKEIAARITQLIEEYDMEYITEEIPIASEQMIDGVNRVSDIIKAMTEFSHPGRGFKEKADINGLLKSTLVMVQNRIKKSADIQLALSREIPQITCFPAELNQVFLNLLVNALDAIVEAGNWGLIKITTGLESKEVLISISDNGCGIPEENSDDIFNPFFTTKEVGKGTGQGLSLAHNVIIEKHKGKLDFSSKVGEGTTFFIRLPIEAEQEGGH